jgi:dihydroxyacetone kinase-like protein
MLNAAANTIRVNCDQLSKLDSAIGDGAHGTTIARAMGIVEKAVQETDKKEIKALLNDVDLAVMGVDGWATGALLGSFLMGLSDGIADQASLDCEAMAALFEAGLSSVRNQTKAQVGTRL